ncbi:MAG: hypothetical protein ACFCGT_19845 [Sandaracinaceae bacterium]
MDETKGGNNRRWLYIGGGCCGCLVLVGIIGAVLGGFGLMTFGRGVAEQAQLGAQDAEPYRGRPIRECYDAAFQQMVGCQGDITCQTRGQVMLQACLEIADGVPAFCASYEGQQACVRDCPSGLDEMSCGFLCGRLDPAIQQACSP